MKRCENMVRRRFPCGRICADTEKYCTICRRAKERAAKRRSAEKP